ncbi:MAG TPA: class I SAM-dependent methyltransferase [Candidatus Mediterraneibacter norfolkensis]|nr:class I SAM-dependent methyltransferase [Candidatus Mediterraneibacter norfolkensis]
MWREPYHITYSSRESLTRLLEQAGFEILRYSVSGHYNGSMEMLCRKKGC